MQTSLSAASTTLQRMERSQDASATFLQAWLRGMPASTPESAEPPPPPTPPPPEVLPPPPPAPPPLPAEQPASTTTADTKQASPKCFMSASAYHTASRSLTCAQLGPQVS